MAVSMNEQRAVQSWVAALDTNRLEIAYEEAQYELACVAFVAKQKLLSAAEERAFHVAIEKLVRIETRLSGGGSFTRMRRRMSLAHQAMTGKLQHVIEKRAADAQAVRDWQASRSAAANNPS